MPYITREDGERFIIPSYRDVLSAKKTALLKREITLLSSNYGDYIVIQRKNVEQYEVAFSPDPGFLLGESVWDVLKHPTNMIYCEALPNGTDAILVIVKSGSVYLDGSFPLDSIPEELIVFKTQQNIFDIYIHGDVPITEKPEPGKFSFDSHLVKSFTVLDAPIFPTLPTIKKFQLQLVDKALKAQNIGVLPIKKVILGFIAIGLLWMVWNYFTTHEKVLPISVAGVINPYQGYMDALTSPDPEQELHSVLSYVNLLFTLPGWVPETVEYSNRRLVAYVKSRGARTDALYSWAIKNRATVDVQPTGFYLIWNLSLPNRYTPSTVNRLQDVIADMVDRMSYTIPGNTLQVATYNNKGVYQDTILTITFDNVSPATLDLIRRRLNNLPLVLSKISMRVDTAGLSGSIDLQALGY